MNILIVDDSKAMRTIIIRTLGRAGFGEHSVHEAVNGADALKQIAVEKPDLILSDWDMPEMTGIELLEALTKQGTQVKFGFVTSEGSPEMRRRAMDAGALFLIAKPFTAETFQQTLSGLLAERPGDALPAPDQGRVPTAKRYLLSLKLGEQHNTSLVAALVTISPALAKRIAQRRALWRQVTAADADAVGGLTFLTSGDHACQYLTREHLDQLPLAPVVLEGRGFVEVPEGQLVLAAETTSLRLDGTWMCVFAGEVLWGCSFKYGGAEIETCCLPLDLVVPAAASL